MTQDTTTDGTPTVDHAPVSRDASASHFPCFDGLRAIAACAVFVAHATGSLSFSYHGVDWAPKVVLDWLFRLGVFGVAVFFVISGFLLYRPYVMSSFRQLPAPRLGVFWFRRFMRIFPAYWLVITVTIFVIQMINPRSYEDYVTYYGLFLTYRSGYGLLGLGVEWTLVIEVAFYIALPAIAWALRSLSRSDAPVEHKVRTQVAGLAAIIVFVTFFRVWHLWIFRPAADTPGTWFSPSNVGLWMISYLDWFAFGMLLAVVSARMAMGRPAPRFLAVLGRHPWVSWLMTVVCYFLITRVHYPIIPGQIARSAQEFLALEMWIVAAFFLVLPAVIGNQDSGGIRAMLRTRVFVALGLISYGIYLWHVPLFDVAADWRHDVFPEGAWRIPMVFALTVAAAAGTYFLVERPARRLAQRLTSRRITSSPGASVREPAPPVLVPAAAAAVAVASAPESDGDDDALAIALWIAVAGAVFLVGLVLPSLPVFSR
jgi:peptidoglycan/LPS O-acetylase OafA/YrhL